MDSDSDDDFLNTSFVATQKSRKRPRKKSSTPNQGPTPSKCPKKSSQLTTPKKSPKKAKYSHSQATTVIVPKRNDTTVSHCVNCQMPFNLLLRWESPEVHASSCLETDFRKVPACPQGMCLFYPLAI